MRRSWAPEEERRRPALYWVLTIVSSLELRLRLSGETGEIGGEVCEGFFKMPLGRLGWESTGECGTGLVVDAMVVVIYSSRSKEAELVFLYALLNAKVLGGKMCACER